MATVKQPEKPPSASQRISWVHRLRVALIGLLVLMGCMFFGAYVVVHWGERQILTTNNWVALVGPLPGQPVVSTALGRYVSNQVFAAAPIEQKITEALPEKAAFLAGPLTSQLNT